MLVFRDALQAVSGRQLVEAIISQLRPFSATIATRNSMVDVLLHAGELECALADVHDPAAGLAGEITDELAMALVANRAARTDELEQKLHALAVPEALSLSRPEGFAYYALHPLDFASLAASLPLCTGRVAVVGIRSIGTTLSAVVAAQTRSRGFTAERTTMRPGGHPWDRRLDLASGERAWINRQNERQAEFWVVDEGPGLSGSSFLAAGEALVNAGVPRERIAFLGSVPPNPNSLRAPQAAARWVRFRFCAVPSVRRGPAEAAVSVGGGEWRKKFLNGAEWPAVWPQFERAKFLSRDGQALFKFEGLGRFGVEVRERAGRLAEAGFGPEASGEEAGYVRYGIIAGRVPTGDSQDVIEQIAGYCAWRASFAAEPRSTGDLEQMMRTNAREGLGEELDLPELRIEKPVVPDGRMHPHEWRLTPEGRLIKLDGASHGDDHFFPGSTDIAWDLAGAMTEYRLEPAAANFLLQSYCRASGDDPRARMPGFLLAYTLFRLGYCAMAAESLRGSSEEMRFRRDVERYRAIASRYRIASTGLTNRL
jgi:hypothetical protein